MPIVPTFENDVRAVPAPGAPMADPSAFGKVGGAIAQGGAQVEGVEREWNERYSEARRQADASNAVAAASKQLGDLQFKWSKVPDRAAATAGFNTDADALEKTTYAAIDNPLVRAHVQDRVSQERIIRGLDTQNASFALESSKRRGDVDTNLMQFAQSAAAAGVGPVGDALRAKLTDDGLANIHGAVAAGWLAPEEGAQHELAFRSQLQEVQVRQLKNQALESQNPNAMQALALKLSDPTSFPSLNPDRREVLAQGVESMQYRLEIRRASQQAHADAMADRSFHQAQAHNEAVTLAGVNSGQQLSDAQIQQLADHQQISAGGVEALHNARIRLEDGNDDPSRSLPLWHAIDTGNAHPQDIYDAFNARQLSKNTATTMIQKLDAAGGNTDTTAAKNAFTVLKTSLSGAAVDSGLDPFGQGKQHAAMLWTEAQGEWGRRILSGEDPSSVLTDLVGKYSPRDLKPTWLAPTQYGMPQSTKDVMTLGMKLGAALKGGQINEQQFQQQGQLINLYRHFYALEDQRRAAQAAASARAAKVVTQQTDNEAAP